MGIEMFVVAITSVADGHSAGKITIEMILAIVRDTVYSVAIILHTLVIAPRIIAAVWHKTAHLRLSPMRRLELAAEAVEAQVKADEVHKSVEPHHEHDTGKKVAFHDPEKADKVRGKLWDGIEAIEAIRIFTR